MLLNTISRTKLRKSVRVLGLPSLIILASAWCIGAAQGGNSEAPPPPTQASLEAAAAKFTKILKDKDVTSLVLELSRNGVYLGVDSDKLPYKEAVKSLNEKGGIYYVFFETQLLNGKRDPQRMVSLRDQLMEAKSVKIHAAIASEKGKIYGDVTLLAVGNPAFGDRGDDFCSLVYVFEGGAWKIMNVEYL
jgi:hypothetical protein